MEASLPQLTCKGAEGGEVANDTEDSAALQAFYVQIKIWFFFRTRICIVMQAGKRGIGKHK
jgi:hypothetical protein